MTNDNGKEATLENNLLWGSIFGKEKVHKLFTKKPQSVFYWVHEVLPSVFIWTSAKLINFIIYRVQQRELWEYNRIGWNHMYCLLCIESAFKGIWTVWL